MIRRILSSISKLNSPYVNSKALNHCNLQQKGIFSYSLKNIPFNIKDERQDRQTVQIIKKHKTINKSKTLQQILIQYKKQSQKQSFIVQKLLYTCRAITQSYTKQKHYEYVRQSKTLQKLLQHIGRQQFNNATLEDYLILINLFSLLKRIQNINKSILDVFRDMIAMKLLPYIKKYNQLALKTKINVYCGLSELNFSDLQLLSKPLSIQFKQILNTQNDIDLQCIQLFLETMARKRNHSAQQKEIFEISLIFIEVNLQNFNQLDQLKFCSHLNSDCLAILTQSKSIDKLYTSIFSKTLKQTQEGFDDQPLEFVLSSVCQAGGFMGQIQESIYQMLMQKIVKGQYHQNILQYLSRVTFKLRGKKYPQKHVISTLKYIQKIIKNNKKNQFSIRKKTIELICLQLINNNFFDQHLEPFKNIINNSQFQVYWSFPYEYSRRNVIFPIDRILQKIKHNSFTLKRDINFLKMAVSIAIQSNLQNHPKLLQIFTLIKKNVNSQQFKIQDVEWLNRQARSHSNLVKLFHKHYCLQFQEFIQKQNLKLLLSNTWNYSFKYWIYLFTVIDQSESKTVILSKASPKIITMMVKRQLQNFNPIVNINQNLLQCIIRGIKSGQINFQSNFHIEIMDLLHLYIRELSHSSDSQIELFLNLVNVYIKQYKEAFKDESFCYLLAKIISHKDEKITNNRLHKITKTNIQNIIIPFHNNHQCVNLITKYLNSKNIAV